MKDRAEVNAITDVIIMCTVRQVVKENRVSAIITMHDINLTLRFADRYIFLSDGNIFAHAGHEIVMPETIEQVLVFLQL